MPRRRHANGVAHGSAEQQLERIKSAGAHPSNESRAPKIGSELDAGGAQQQMVAARHASATFGEIVTLLMRAPAYKGLPLGDLESLVVPPLRVGQVSVATAQSQSNGVTAPVGALLWARVSPEVAGRLTAHVGEDIRLAPDEWKSGDIVWVVASVGDGRVLSEMLKQLSKREWAGKDVRIVVRPKDGKPTVATFATGATEAA